MQLEFKAFTCLMLIIFKIIFEGNYKTYAGTVMSVTVRLMLYVAVTEDMEIQSLKFQDCIFIWQCTRESAHKYA